MKSKELKVYNLPNDSFFICEICAKPTILFLFIFFVGVISLFFPFPKAYGLITILTALACICFMPRAVMVEFYNDYMVLYNKADKNTCSIIYYNEVSSWYYTWGTSRDFLVIELQDGNQEKIEAFSKTIFEVNMSRFLKDKHVKNL